MARIGDFSPTIKKSLAERVGMVCSFPGCYAPTIGPSEEAPTSSSNTGMYVSPCSELYYKGELDSITCNEGIYSKYKLEPVGEFVISNTSAAPLTVDNPAQPRDSLSLAIGKCSVIAP